MANRPTKKLVLPDEGLSHRQASVVPETNRYQSLALRSMFWKPDYLDPSGSAWVEHLPFAFWVVEALQPRMFVELGTHNGHSYFSFCQAVKRLGLNTPSFAIDTWKGDDQAGKYDESVYQQVSAYNESHYREFSSLLRCTFDDALCRFTDGSIDLLHIDGFHSYEAVRHDFETWLPKLSDRAVVLFHDTNVRRDGFGVHKFFAEIAARYPHFEFIHGHGLGVLGVGAEQSEMISTLFSCYSHQPSRNIVYELFSRLGSYCHDGMDLNVEKKNASRHASKVNELERLASERQGEIDRGREREAGLSGRVSELERLASERQGEIDRGREREAGLSSRVSELERLVGERQGEIERGREREAGLSGRVGELERLVGERQGEIERGREREAVLSGRVGELERLVGERQGEIERGREREAGLSGRVGELERLVGERQEEIDRTGSLLDEARLQLAAVRVEADEALRGLERAAERGRELELEADRLSAELGVVRSALSSERQEVGRLGDEMSRLSAVEVELRAQVSERSNESEEKARLIVEREARIDILNREKSAWYEERERWVAEVTGLRTTVECLSSEKRALSEQVEERQRNIDERFRELADCARMIFERDEQIERLNREKSEGAEFREQMNAEVAGLRSQLDVSSSEKRAVQDLLAVSQRNIDERFGELADCARMIIERDNRIEALNGEVETLKGLVERMNRMPLVRLTRCFLRPFRPLFSQRRRAFKRTVRMVRESGYFDAGYYLRNYPDVAKSGMDAVVHYLRHGALEGRNPSERFDTAGYLAKYPDVAAKRNRLNPLVHFLTHGRAEGREPR